VLPTAQPNSPPSLAPKWSLRQIARHLNLNRRTVAKYLIQPAQPRPRPQRTSKLEPFHAAIGELLEQDPDASAVMILQRLRGRGFEVGITILKDYLHQVRTESAARVRARRIPTRRSLRDRLGHFRRPRLRRRPAQVVRLLAGGMPQPHDVRRVHAQPVLRNIRALPCSRISI